MLATLKKSLGEAGGFIDDSHGEDRLYKVLKALAEEGAHLSAYQDTIATAILAAMVVDKATKLVSLRTAVAVCGVSGQTDVRVRVNGTLVGATATTLNTDADGTKVAVDQDIDLVAGDLVQLEVTAAPGTGTGLSASLHFRSVTVQS
ncbi:MAG: hypothetical protein AB7W59_00145 [Acidimicrobiia bacterium]